MNKGLEVIEAHHLFGVAGERIDVLVHPQSLVHSLVEFVDGSTLAQLGLPDMRTALAVGLGWPERIDSGVGRAGPAGAGRRLDFEPPDLDAFPCLRLAFEALRRRRHRAGGAQCGQRSRGFSLSSAADRLSWRSPRWSRPRSPRCPPSRPTSLAALRDADASARRQPTREAAIATPVPP